MSSEVFIFAAVAVAVAWFYIYLGWIESTTGPPLLVTSRLTDTVNRFIARMPILKREPRPPIWWSNPHIQFAPWLLQGLITLNYYKVDYQRIVCPTPCGKDTNVLDVYPPFEENQKALPIVMIMPGLRGHSQDCPGLSVVKRFVANKFRVVVHNRRGHTPGEQILDGSFHVCGDSDDTSCCIRTMRKKYPVLADVPIFLFGISMGSGLSVQCIGHWDQLRTEGRLDKYGFPPPEKIACGIMTSAGFDVSKCLDRFAEPYRSILLQCLKEHFVEKNEAVLRKTRGDAAVDEILNAKSMRDFVDCSYKFSDLESTEAWYERYNPVKWMPHLRTPCCVIISFDDPITVVSNALEASPYPEFKGMSYRQHSEANTNCPVLGVISKTGGHCTFMDGGNFGFMECIDGFWQLRNWSDDVAIEFCLAVLAEGDFDFPGEAKKAGRAKGVSKNRRHSKSDEVING